MVVFFLMIRRPPRSTLDRSSAASDVYKRQVDEREGHAGEADRGVGGVQDLDELRVVRADLVVVCLLYTSPSPRDRTRSRMPSSA